jgi:hypothetical protein
MDLLHPQLPLHNIRLLSPLLPKDLSTADLLLVQVDTTLLKVVPDIRTLKAHLQNLERCLEERLPLQLAQ